MIIDCTNCNKKFEIDKSLIPDHGRLLQCSSCNHEWFFKKDLISEVKYPVQNENLEVIKKTNDETINPTTSNDNKNDDDQTEVRPPKNINKNIIKNHKNKKGYGVLSLIVLFLISFIALIILIDTFKSPLGKIVPNIEFFLYNFYESFRDITLFIKDLV
jgi:predicted Zn finger-like uncharacterized protein